MTDQKPKLDGPDFTCGVALATIPTDSVLLGHADGEPVLLARRGDDAFAVGAVCTHYSGPLAEGILVDETIRCPWHHACFSLLTGAALRAPALNPIACWRVERQGGTIFVREKIPTTNPTSSPVATGSPKNVVIVGGGAAGNAAAETLRQEGFAGHILLLSADEAAPYDRPNLSKDYLAGTASEDWIPLRSPEFYAQHAIELKLGARATAIDTTARLVTLANGDRYPFDALLLATGADPVPLAVQGAERPHVHYLRSLADSRAIIASAGRARHVVVIGASFIGLEVAAALRTRNLEVHVVAPDARPLARILGPEIGDLVRAIHQEHGVVFHLGRTVLEIAAKSVTLDNGETLSAELVVVGIGVRPALALAKGAGLAIDRGIAVDEYLESSVTGIFAAGDIARWPDRSTGERIRVEHWVVAERQGQVAARNMLGRRQKFDAIPFFWSQHYDLAINYVGHAETWDRIAVDGNIGAKDGTATFWRGGRKLAVATVFRDRESLLAEVEFERTGSDTGDSVELSSQGSFPASDAPGWIKSA